MAKPIVNKDFLAGFDAQFNNPNTQDFLAGFDAQFNNTQEDKGFFSNSADLLQRGGQSAIAAADVSTMLLAGTDPVNKAKTIAKELSTPQPVNPKELQEAQAAFVDEAAAFEKAKHWYSPDALVATAGMLGEFGKQILTNPEGAAYITEQSAANMVPAIVSMMASSRIGAGLGSIAGPGGATVGGVIGGVGGAIAGQVPMETGSEFIGLVGKELSNRKLAPTEANVNTLFADKKWLNKAISDARTKGITTAAVDGATTMLGGRLATAPRRAAIEAAKKELGAGADAVKLAERATQIVKDTPRLQKISAGAQGVGLDVVGGGASEAAGQEAAYGKVNLADVGQEMLGELGGAAIEVPAAAYSATRDLMKPSVPPVVPPAVTPAGGIPPVVSPAVPPAVTPAGIPPVATSAPVLTDADVEDLQAEQPVTPVTPTPVATAPTPTPAVQPQAPVAQQPSALPEGWEHYETKNPDGTITSGARRIPTATPVETAPVLPATPLHTVVNNETKMEASVYPRDDGTFNVAQKDLESGETLDTFKNFKTQEEAIKYAETIQTPVAPKPTEVVKDTSELEKKVSSYYQDLLDKHPDASEGWKSSVQELAGNPNRYHQVEEQENPKGIKVGDTVISGFGKTAQTNTVLSVTKDKALIDSGEPNRYGGWTDLDQLNQPNVEPTQLFKDSNKTFNFGTGEIDVSLTRMGVSPETYKNIYKEDGGILSFDLRGDGLSSETGYRSASGISYTGKMTPERLEEIMLSVAQEHSKKPKTPAQITKEEKIATNLARQDAAKAKKEASTKSEEETIVDAIKDMAYDNNKWSSTKNTVNDFIATHGKKMFDQAVKLDLLTNKEGTERLFPSNNYVYKVSKKYYTEYGKKKTKAQIAEETVKEEPKPKEGLFDETELEANFKRIKDSTVRFSSGLTAISDLTSGAQTVRGNELSGIGIDIGQLSANGLKVLAEKILGGARVFVDSGAFSAFRSNLKNNEDNSLNFDAILQKYDAITEAIADINVHDDDYPSPMLVMPDIVGNQEASIKLAEKYAKYIKGEADYNSTIPIVPIQKGELSLAEVYRKLVGIIGTDNFVVGLPSKAEAISKDELKAFLQEIKPANVHFLGAAADRTLNPLLHIVAEVSPDTKVTADASQIRSKILSNVKGGMNRKDAINHALNDYSDPQWDDEFRYYGVKEADLQKVRDKIASGIKSGLDSLKAFNAALDMYAPKETPNLIKAAEDIGKLEIVTVTDKKPTKQPKSNYDIDTAKKDLDDALSDLGSILSASTRANIMPEEEQKLIPVLVRVMDAAFRLGYYKFKDASKFVLDTIRNKFGKDVADKISLDHLQGAYISMAGRYEETDTIVTVATFNSLDEIMKEAKHDLSNADSRFKASSTLADFFISGGKFSNIVEARKKIAEILELNPILPGTNEAKQADETVESAIVIAGRKTVEESRKSGLTTQQTYDKLLDLYNRQPNLSMRSSTSVRDQAYSTPLPLAYVASEFAGINDKTTVLEPTAGNGMLLVGANPKNVTANELNPSRSEMIKLVIPEADVTTDNATTITYDKKFDAVIENPPFGSVRDDKSKTITFDINPNYKTIDIDHAIVMKSLEAMKDNGRAVLIVGGTQAETEDARREDYRGKSKREFYYNLYKDYNVVDHFSISGSMYTKQGASFPVDFIVIDGRGKSSRNLPASELPKIIASYEQLKEKLNEASRMVPRGNIVTSGTNISPSTTGGTDREGLDNRPVGQGNRPSTEGTRPTTVSETGVQVPRPAVSGQPTTTGGNISEAQSGTKNIPVTSNERGGVPSTGETKSGSTTSAERSDLVGLGKPSEVRGESVQSGLKDRRGLEEETSNQVTYNPYSQGTAIGTLVPRAMSESINNAIQKVQDEVGNLDNYVADALNMDTETLKEKFSAEQIDALVLAIRNAEAGKGFIIGDQTGVGKGRVVAAMIKYALVNGKIPIFVTEKPNLYSDMIRDLDDIGMTKELGLDTKVPKILMTNSSDAVPYSLIRNVKGEVVENEFTLRSPKSGASLNNLMSDMISKDSIGDYKVIFTTYSQLQTVKGKPTERQRFISNFAEGNYLICDESHNAGGTGDAKAKEGIDTSTGRANFVRNLVSNSFGSFFSSATYAKRPDVMDLYSSTNMSLAVDRPNQLAEAIKHGGIPMQQMVANMLTKDGQYIRRERTFAGVTYDTHETKVDKKTAENMATAMRKVLEFSRAKEPIVKDMQKDLDKAGAVASILGEKTTIQSANFGSIMHNLIDQMLLSLKVEDSINLAIEKLKAGEKVVMTVSNTMGSFLKDFAEENDINIGDEVNLSFKDVYQKYLQKQREVTIKKPDGTKEKYYLTDEDLGPRLTSMFNNTRDAINGFGFGSAPISPIDYLHSKLQQAGYTTDEITGRNNKLNYAGGTATYDSRSSNIKQRVNAVRNFNNGTTDVIILNQAGSTGLSLHASSKFKDQRKRNMIIVQPEKNIDTHMQMLGRVHRTGQIQTPSYYQMMADIPAEMRPAAVLLKKMASLNANTTASRKSAITAEGSVDFMNDYGGQVAQEYLRDNPDVSEAIGDRVDLKDDSTEGTEEDIRKFTGYIPILPIKQQEEIYKDLIDRYNDLIESENNLGTNKLEAKAMDLDAETITTVPITEHKGETSVFAEPANMERIDIKRTVKPYSSEEVKEDIKENLGGKTSVELAREKNKDLFDRTKVYRDERVAKAKEDNADEVRLNTIDQQITTAYNHVKTINETYRIGDAISVKDSKGVFVYGVITNTNSSNRTANPSAPSDWKMHIALANGDAKSITLTFSQIDKQFTLEKQPYNVDYLNTETLKTEYIPVIDMFDKASTTRREKRWMVTGNILAGFALYPGQIVTFTKQDGSVSQGVLMSRNFDFEKEQKNAPVKIKSAEDVIKSLNQFYRSSIGTLDNLLRISKDYNEYVFTVPSSKKSGGTYFLDKGLTDAIGNEFFKRGSIMNARAYGETNALKAINYIMQNRGEPLYAVTDQQKVKAYLYPKVESARGKARLTGQTAETVLQRLHGEFGKAGINSMMNRGLLTIVNNADELPANIKSEIDATTVAAHSEGKVYLIANRLQPDGIRSSLLHEIGEHYGLRAIVGEEAYSNILNEIDRLRPIDATVRDAFTHVEKMYPDLKGNRDRINREVLARVGEEAPQHSLWRKIVSAFKTFLVKHGFKTNLTTADIHDLIQYSLHKAMKGDIAQTSKRPSIEYSRINAEEDQRVLDDLGVPAVPSHDQRTFKEFLLGGWKKTQETAVDVYHEPKENTSSALAKTGEFLTLQRIRNFWYGAGLEAADMARYSGQIRDAFGRLLPSIALKNAIKSAYISTRVILDGGLEMNTMHGIFMAVKKAHSMANIFTMQANLRKDIGTELADRVINSYFVAKRSRGIQTRYFEISKEIRDIEEQLLVEEDQDKIVQLSSELDAAKVDLKNIKIAYEKIPAYLCKIDEDEPTIKTDDGKEIPNVLYDSDGLPELNDDAMDALINQEEKYSDLTEMMTNWTAVNHNMLDMMAFSGRISKKMADKLKAIKDYSPWARIVDDRQDLYDARLMSTRTTGIKHFKAGRTELDVDNVIEAMTNNVQQMVKSTLRTYAYNRIAIEYGSRKPNVVDKKTGVVTPGKLRVFPDQGRFAGQGVRIPIFANGKQIIIQIEDSNVAEAMLGLAMAPVDFPFQNLLSKAANFTRRSVTFSLYFQAKQVFYDAPTAAWVSGVRNPLKLWAGCFSGFARAVNPIHDDATAMLLQSAGFGGFQSHHRSAKGELQLELGILNHSLFSRLMKGIDKFGDASDLSQRIPIYEQTIAETGDPMLAILKASDVMDFQKSGNGKMAQFLKVTIPFIQAWATQIDALGQAMVGGNLKGMSRKEAQWQFAKTGTQLAGICLLYAMAAGGDDDYWELDDETRLRNFYIPGSKKVFGHHVLIPMHSSAAFFFKVMPEWLYSTITSQSTKNAIDATRFRKVLAESAVNSILGPTPIPSGVKPTIEIAFNHDFYTGNTVTPRGLENLDAAQQYNASTSELGKMLSSLTGTDKSRLLNPIEADKFMRGMAGSIASLSQYYSNVLNSDKRVAPQLRQNPLTGGLVGADTQRKYENLFYGLRDETESAEATFKKLHERGMHDQADAYLRDNIQLVKAQGYVKAVGEDLGRLNKEIKRVGESPDDKTFNTPQKRLDRINELKEIKNNILKDVVQVRKQAGL